MRRMLQGTLSVIVLLSAAFAAAAQGYKVEKSADAPPADLAPAVRETLAADALRITGPAGPVGELWLRATVPAKASPDQSLGIEYGQLSVGELVGAIRFDAPVKDYRAQSVKPGTYTLRYALQPVDGNHLGVSTYRDYLLLVPAALDSAPAPFAEKDLFAASRKAAGTGHPSVWSLTSTDGAPASLPGVAHQEDGDLWVLFFQAKLGPEGGAGAPTKLALVIAGHAQEP